MKILILANNDVGLYKFRKELIQKLGETNEIWISLPDGQFISSLEEIGCHFIRTELDRRGMNPLKDIKLVFSYRKILKAISPDLVITYTIKPNIYGGICCRLFGYSYAVNITGLGSAFQSGSKIKGLVEALYKFSCGKAKKIFFENRSNRDYFEDHRLIHPSQSVLLNGAGVNLQEYPLLPFPEGNTTRFLFIGRLMKEKGVNELLEASKRLHEEGFNISLDLVGPMEEDSFKVLDQFKYSDWLNYHGFQRDVLPYVKGCSCFVLPSWHEGMANTNLECASCGRPVITSDIPGCNEAVENTVTGYLVKAKNPESLYQAMKKICLLPDEYRCLMGILGRERMSKMFDRNLIVSQTVYALIN